MIKKIKNSFVNEPVNLGRQSELDVAKGIAIIFMVFCHSFEILCDFFNPEISTDFAYGILDVVLGGSFAAPVLCSVWESASVTVERTVPKIWFEEH